jgi:uncharacterized NAD(P)/FAD-binding protein YdhS
MVRAYERDYAGWAEDTAKAIEEGRFSEIDRAALADEVASLGRSAKRELTSSLRVLLTHMLKARYQHERHTRSWDDTIRRERRNANKFLTESPSLKTQLDAILADAYEDAIYQAESETRLALNTFPVRCEWTMSEILGEESRTAENGGE